MSVQELLQMAERIHGEAVLRGEWAGKKDLERVWQRLSLVHCCWSDAVRAKLNGSPMHWRNEGKPEGIAVELVRGCIGLLDILGMVIGAEDYQWMERRVYDAVHTIMDKTRFHHFPLSWLVMNLHKKTDGLAVRWDSPQFNLNRYVENVLVIVGLVRAWLAEHRVDMYGLMDEELRAMSTRSPREWKRF